MTVFKLLKPLIFCHIPSEIRIGSFLVAARVLATSLSSPVEPFPHQTKTFSGTTMIKQSLEFNEEADKITCNKISDYS